MIIESYDSEELAAVALQRQAERKRRRGYAEAKAGYQAKHGLTPPDQHDFEGGGVGDDCRRPSHLANVS